MDSQTGPAQGKNKSKSRRMRRLLVARRARANVLYHDVGCNTENPVTGSLFGVISFVVVCLRSLLSGMNQCLVKMWASKRYWLLLFFMWALVLLCGSLSFGFSNSLSPDQYITDNGNGQSLEEKTAWDNLLNFFFPTTCNVKENEEMIPCMKNEDLEERTCLKYKCCFSSSETSKFRCFAPLKDKPKQMLRIFGLGVINMIVLGCLPVFCYSLFRRSKLADYLQRIVDNIFKCLRNRRDRSNEDTEMIIGRSVESEDEESEEDEDDEEGEINSQETRALLSR